MPNKTDADTSRSKSEDRYPAPKVFEPPEDIKKTLPTEEELDDLIPLFTWGELKEIVSKFLPRSLSPLQEPLPMLSILPVRPTVQNGRGNKADRSQNPATATSSSATRR